MHLRFEEFGSGGEGLGHVPGDEEQKLQRVTHAVIIIDNGDGARR